MQVQLLALRRYPPWWGQFGQILSSRAQRAAPGLLERHRLAAAALARGRRRFSESLLEGRRRNTGRCIDAMEEGLRPRGRCYWRSGWSDRPASKKNAATGTSPQHAHRRAAGCGQALDREAGAARKRTAGAA